MPRRRRGKDCGSSGPARTSAPSGETRRRLPFASPAPKVSRPANCPRSERIEAETSSSGGASRRRSGGSLLRAGDGGHANADDYRSDPSRRRYVFAEQSPRQKSVHRIAEGRNRQHEAQIGPRERDQIEPEKYTEKDDAQPD